MERDVAPSRAERHTGRRRTASSERRPDRVAMWAVMLGLFAMIAAAASAQAATTGAPTEGAPPAPGECPAYEFGNRPLKLGDCGTDVQTLKWLLKSKPIGTGVIPDGQFDESTDQAVKAFQSEAGISSNGVVDEGTRTALRRSMNRATVTWYGPGFFGNQTSCDVTLTRETLGVAHRTLPCGTRVTFFAHGNWATAEVIDRGPFARGVGWDLTAALAQQLGVQATERVRAAVVPG